MPDPRASRRGHDDDLAEPTKPAPVDTVALKNRLRGSARKANQSEGMANDIFASIRGKSILMEGHEGYDRARAYRAKTDAELVKHNAQVDTLEAVREGRIPAIPAKSPKQK